MATLNIRNLPDCVHQALRLRAARAGRSMEAEARAIIAAACAEDEGAPAEAADLQALVDALYGRRKPRGVVQDLIEERRREAAEET